MFTPQQALQRLLSNNELFHDEMTDLMRQIMRGEVAPELIAAILIGLRIKVETVSEISAAAQVMREFAAQVPVSEPDKLVDVVGTGGAGFRYLYAYFLEQAADICANPALQTASQEMTAIGDQWRQLASQCVKQCRRPSEQGCAQIAAFLREIADREEKLWRGLLHIGK